MSSPETKFSFSQCRIYLLNADNGPHDITLFEILLWAGGMSVVTGDEESAMAKVGRKPLELVTHLRKSELP